jgi:hypothetical protein
LKFPDTSHLLVNTETILTNSAPHASTTLTKTVYEEMQQNYTKLCLEEGVVFRCYTSSKYPDLPTLNMFVQLYFDNFDIVMPILHDQVTHINDHWILALAVCAIGCQYAEADEFSRTVEPLHEFLRRAIMVDFTESKLHNIGQDRHGLAWAQAMTLSQVGMLYFGSPRLLHYAKVQHGAIIALARTLTFQATTSDPVSTPSELDANGVCDSAWRRLIFEECKCRVGYAIWVSTSDFRVNGSAIDAYQLLDCMAAYHFQQQPLMPPNLIPISLPNDKLWQSRSPSDWHTQSSLVQGRTYSSTKFSTSADFTSRNSIFSFSNRVIVPRKADHAESWSV